MDRIQNLLILMRAGDGQNLRMGAGNIFRIGPQTASDNHLTVLVQRFADGLKAFGLGTVEKTAGVHNHSFGPCVVRADGIAFGAQAG